MRPAIRIVAIAAALIAAACSGSNTTTAAGDAPGGMATLERVACFGFCPIYKASVTADEQLVFEGERFVVAEGRQEKRLPAGSFAKLVDIANAHDFAAFDKNYPNEDGSNCQNQATDMPGVNIAVESAELTHSVSFYQGCMGFDGRDRLEAMIAEMDAVLALDQWIGPREQFMGGTKDGQ